MEEIMRNCFAELHMKIAVAGTPETDELLLHAKTSGKIDVHATRSHASACARKSKRFSLNLLTDCEQNGKTIMHDSLCLPIIMFAGSSSPGMQLATQRGAAPARAALVTLNSGGGPSSQP